jgi:hypothetical protein
MNELIKMLKEVYADCTTCQEVAEVYATLKMENQKQMEFIMQTRIDCEIEVSNEN